MLKVVDTVGIPVCVWGGGVCFGLREGHVDNYCSIYQAYVVLVIERFLIVYYCVCLLFAVVCLCFTSLPFRPFRLWRPIGLSKICELLIMDCELRFCNIVSKH